MWSSGLQGSHGDLALPPLEGLGLARGVSLGVLHGTLDSPHASAERPFARPSLGLGGLEVASGLGVVVPTSSFSKPPFFGLVFLSKVHPFVFDPLCSSGGIPAHPVTLQKVATNCNATRITSQKKMLAAIAPPG